MWKRAEKILLKYELAVIIISLVILLRVPTLFEPYWYGDEGIYLTIGQELARGEKLYQDIEDNKPPLLYYVAAITRGNQFWYRFVAMGVNVATVLVFAKLTTKIWNDKQKWARVFAVGVFILLTNIPLWEGNIANAELFFLLPTIGATYLLLKAGQDKVTARDVLMAGLLYGVAGLFKFPAVLECGIWPLLWLGTREKKWFGKSLVLAIGVLAPIILFVLYFAADGTLGQFLGAAGLRNIGYVSVWSSAQGVFATLSGRAVVAGGVILLLLAASGALKRTGLWLGLFIVVALFAATFSGRPYPHYLMQISVPTAIALMMIVWGKKREKIMGGLSIALVLAAYVVFGFWVYSIAGYYTNFVSWVLKQKTTDQYYAWFNPDLKNMYTISAMVKAGTSPDEEVFVWGDMPMVYALANRKVMGKYTTKYHIKDFGAEKETLELLATRLPEYIVVYPTEQLPGLDFLLEQNYAREKEINGVGVYKKSGVNWRNY